MSIGMTERHIIVRTLPGRPRQVLDKQTGVLAPVTGSVSLPLRGFAFPVEGKTFVQYAEDGHMYLQLMARRWEVGASSDVQYGHNLENRTTTFTINGFSIEYEAWWAHDPTFNRFAPERDQDEDALAHVYHLYRNAGERADYIRRMMQG